MDRDYKALLDKADAAKNEAEAARKLLNSVIERVNDGFVALDRNWYYTYVNAHAARMLQREKPEDLIGKHIWTEYPDGIGQPFHLAYLKALETQQPVIFEEHYEPWDLWFENRIYPSADGLTIYFSDITVRKKAEEALRRLAAVFATSQDGIMILDLDAHILRVNQSFSEISGYSESEVIGQLPHQFEYEQQGKHFYHTLWSELRKSGLWQGEIWSRRKNGDIYPLWLTLSTERDEQAKAIAYVGVFSDISERKQSEESLKRVNRTLMVFSSCNETLIRASNETELLDKICSIITEIGHYPLVWIGYAEDDENMSVKPVAQSGFDTGYLENMSISWGDNEQGHGPTSVAIRTGQFVVTKDLQDNYDYKWWQDTAQKYDFASSIALPISASGTIYGGLNIYAKSSDAFDEEEIQLLQELADDLGFGIATLRSHLERQQLQRQLQQAQKMEAIGQLTGGISHDFNNILSSVLGYTELALGRTNADSDTKLVDFLKEVLRAAGRARDLIAQMLAFSRGTANNARPTELESVVTEVVSLLQSTFPSSVSLHAETGKNIPNIMMDPIHLHQVLMNLCINAKDAVEGQGLIEVMVRQVNDITTACDSCHKHIEGEFVELSVRDNGSGIGLAEVDRVFAPFFSTKETGKGTGMGLAMVHGIVHEHNGHILVETEIGKGTTFHLLFPAVTEKVQATDVDESILSASISDANTGNLMVVDDDESVAMFVSELLSLAGYTVTKMTKSMEALSVFQQNPQDFDLVITDQTMPDITGIDLAKKMIKIRSDIPIILCSGYSERLDGYNAKTLGVQHFLQKPFRPKLLLEAVAELLHVKEDK